MLPVVNGSTRPTEAEFNAIAKVLGITSSVCLSRQFPTDSNSLIYDRRLRRYPTPAFMLLPD